VPIVVFLGLACISCDRFRGESDATKKPKFSAIVGDEEEVEHGNPTTEPNICFEAQRQRIPVIMYHDLVAERTKESLWYDCSLAEFEAQMEAIDLEGFKVISLDDLYEHLTTGKRVPEKSIVLTFDDNYQSFYDLAWPVIKKYNYPVAMFVHTAFVGVKTGRPKMDYVTLQELSRSSLFTVGGHTINHYLDLKDRSITEQKNELELSKSELEIQLDIKVDYLAYPNGSNGDDTQILAQGAGYKMAFTIENSPAEESPNIYAVGRYVHTKFSQAIQDAYDAQWSAPATIARYKWKEESPVRYKKGDFAGIPLRMVTGGHPVSVMSELGREPVKAFVDREQGVAGINGGFFAMAAIASTDKRMVGPLKTSGMLQIEPDDSPERWPKINNRPLVIWSDEEFAILPYIPAQMRDEEQYSWFMKNYTDCFMGGVWLVHKGVARPRELQDVFGASDIQDYRRRAFIGITAEGEFVAGAATTSVSSEKFAEAIAEAGVEEAVLIDSGFSTSLIFDGKVKASGHSSASEPSRPVPHAIVILGEIDPSSKDTEDLKSVDSRADTSKPARTSRRRRK
jgi:poly-beta-1,6-N-acetyl-D-glucosamine N-deacetylase